MLDPGHVVAVLGNHDSWVLDPDSAPADIAGEIARQNARDLASEGAIALNWLSSLAPMQSFDRDGWRLTLAHGTPDDPLEGRYYPDDRQSYDWLPRSGEIVILGQTHYPILRGDGRSGLLLNPGSAGQPRDGNPMPSWALLNLATGCAELRRTVYDNRRAMERLRAMHWHDQLVRALDRRRMLPRQLG